MTRAERLDEVARLLALAMLRRKERMEDSPESDLDSRAQLRLHVKPKGGRQP
jgi:hypothetical protein